ncbi:hypothetical protein FQN60_006887, partial [Etheostoma spectabile]
MGRCSHRGLSFINEAELGGVLPPLHLLQVQDGLSRVWGHAGGLGKRLEKRLGKGGVMDDGWLDEEREGLEMEEGCGTGVRSWGEVLSDGGAERWDTG